MIEQLIVGTRHVEVQTQLLEKGDSLDGLDVAVETVEVTKSHVAEM